MCTNHRFDPQMYVTLRERRAATALLVAVAELVAAAYDRCGGSRSAVASCVSRGGDEGGDAADATHGAAPVAEDATLYILGSIICSLYRERRPGVWPVAPCDVSLRLAGAGDVFGVTRHACTALSLSESNALAQRTKKGKYSR